MRYELTDDEWTAIKPMLPNTARGVPRVNDRRVLNGIFWVLRSGAQWRDLRGARFHQQQPNHRRRRHRPGARPGPRELNIERGCRPCTPKLHDFEVASGP